MDSDQIQAPQPSNGETGDPLRRFHPVPFPVEIELARFDLDLQTLLRTREGDTVRTGRTQGSPMRLIAGRVELATADIMALDGRLAARVERVLTKGDEPPHNGAL